MKRMTSLLLVEERFLEAEYFAKRLRTLSNPAFGYELNAFLSAARSVTFLLQKEMNGVPGFSAWWGDRQERMRSDPAMRFFLELRNFSQKEGSIAVAGTMGKDSGNKPISTHYFLGYGSPLPASLFQRDVVECCREHLAKLASLVLQFADSFPFHSCPRCTVTQEGLEVLKLTVSDIKTILGPPVALVEVEEMPQHEVLHVLRHQFDGVNFDEIARIASYKPTSKVTYTAHSEQLEDKMTRDIVRRLAILRD